MIKANFERYLKHYKALIYLGSPIVLGQLGIIILGVSDTFMIGHHSTEELAAASFVNNVFGLAIIFSIGFAYGLTPIVGGYYGARKFTKIGQALRCSLVANTLVGFLLMLAMGVLYLNLDKLGQPVEIIPLIRSYYILLLPTLLLILLFNAFKQFADGITDTKTAMWILLGGNIVNVCGNYLLINGKLGLPELGLVGAGISTLTVRTLMILAFVLIFFNSKRFYRYKIGFFRLGFSSKIFRKVNNLGWPVAFQMGMETASFSLSAIMIGWLGTIALASHQVMGAVSQFLFLLFYGMGSAVSIRVSNFNGQGDLNNVKQTSSAGFHIILFLALLIGTTIFCLRHYIGGWFTDNDEVTHIVSLLVIEMLIYQLGDGLQINYANALRGISDVKPMMYIAFFAYFVVALPVGYFCGFVLNWGIYGVWVAFPFGLTIAGLLFYLRFRYMTQSDRYYSKTYQK